MEDYKFRVFGRITAKSTGKALGGLIIKAYDKDFIMNDFVGETKTHSNGNYQIRFREVDFSDLFGTEKKPDLFIKVYNSLGKQIGSSIKNVVMDTGFDTQIDFEVEA